MFQLLIQEFQFGIHLRDVKKQISDLLHAQFLQTNTSLQDRNLLHTQHLHLSSSQLGQKIVFSQTDACKTENEIISFSSFFTPNVQKFSSQACFAGADLLEVSQRLNFRRHKFRKKSIPKLLHNFNIIKKYFLIFIKLSDYP